MISQFSLLHEVEEELNTELDCEEVEVTASLEEEDSESSEFTCDFRSAAQGVEAEVIAYVLMDTKTLKKYVGITIDPIVRTAMHSTGRTNNALREIHKTRPEDVIVLRNYSIHDDSYCSNPEISKAHKAEAFLMAYYDSLRNGFNVKYDWHHDFEDTEFWLEQLDGEVLDLYLETDKDQLNNNVANFIPKRKQEYKPSSNRQIRIAKDLLRRELYKYYLMNVKYTLIIKESNIVDKSNVFRFLKGNDGSIGIEKLIQLIDYFENELGITNKFDFESELKKRLYRDVH